MSKRTLKPRKNKYQKRVERERRKHSFALKAAVRRKYQEAVDESLMDCAGEPMMARAKELGLAVTQSSSGMDGTRKLHFGFWRDRWRVADYWASTGTLKVAGITRKMETLPEALEFVASMVGPTKSTGPHGPRPKGASRGRHYPRPTAKSDPSIG